MRWRVLAAVTGAVAAAIGIIAGVSIALSGPGCRSFRATETIAVGSSGVGCIVFEVPATALADRSRSAAGIPASHEPYGNRVRGLL